MIRLSETWRSLPKYIFPFMNSTVDMNKYTTEESLQGDLNIYEYREYYQEIVKESRIKK